MLAPPPIRPRDPASPVAVARVVVGAHANGEPDEAAVTGARPVVLTLYRQAAGDGAYSIVMHRSAARGPRGPRGQR